MTLTGNFCNHFPFPARSPAKRAPLPAAMLADSAQTSSAAAGQGRSTTVVTKPFQFAAGTKIEQFVIWPFSQQLFPSEKSFSWAGPSLALYWLVCADLPACPPRLASPPSRASLPIPPIHNPLRFTMPASDIIIKGAREHNLRDVDLVLPRNQLICLTGVSGQRQEFAGVRHALCRGTAALRRKPVDLRPAVPRPDAQARRRPHQRTEPVDLDFAEVGRQQPALDRRHDHRNLRFPARALTPASDRATARSAGSRSPPNRASRSLPASGRSLPRPSSWCSRRSSDSKRANFAICAKICSNKVSFAPASTVRRSS